MKKIYLLLLITSFQVKAQPWSQLISGTANSLHDIHFPNSTTGYIAGYNGTILKTTDAGNSWQPVFSPKNFDWHSIYFLNENTGFIGGDSSSLFKTDNGGSSWTQITPAQGGKFFSIFFTDSLNGFAGGGDFGETRIMKTNDGGLSWTPAIADTLADRPVTAIHFPSPDTGYATMLGYSADFLKTVDGGNNWKLMPVQLPNFLSNLESVFFTDVLTGYIGGWYNSALIKTTDGGNTWQNLDSSNSPQAYSVFFTDANTGYAAGWYGTLNKTTDGGISWQVEQGINTNHTLYSLYFTNSGVGFAVGDSGYIYRKSAPLLIVKSDIPDKMFSAFPNPNEGLFELRINNSELRYGEIRIFNILGEIVCELNMHGSQKEIDLRMHGPGLYFVQRVNVENVTVKVLVME